ncbi:hypothetical protein DK853_34630, partial [Klebsiella oxytoca]
IVQKGTDCDTLRLILPGGDAQLRFVGVAETGKVPEDIEAMDAESALIVAVEAGAGGGGEEIALFQPSKELVGALAVDILGPLIQK